MKIIDAQAMQSLADCVGIVDWLANSHRESIDAMDDLLMTQPGAGASTDTVLIRAAWQRGKMIGVKLITVFPDNTANSDLPAIQAVYALFDGANGKPLANLDGTELTYWKTAADSALGTKLLARADCEEMLMVGAGAQAPYLIRAHCAVRPSIKRVNVWNRTNAKASALASLKLIDGVEFASVTDIEAASRSADLICTATAAEAPLVLGEWLKRGAHLDLVGGYKPEMIETDAQALRRSRVFVDAYATTVGICGDLLVPAQAGEYDMDDIEADLFGLCRDGLRLPRSAEEITVFKNGGGGHLDLMTAAYFVDAAQG